VVFALATGVEGRRTMQVAASRRASSAGDRAVTTASSRHGIPAASELHRTWAGG
jgi:hypothetical protein